MDDFLLIDHYIATPLHIVNRHAHPSWIVPVGQRDFHNIMLVVSGRGTCFFNDKEHDMQSGQLFYHPVNESFGYTSSVDQPLHCLGGNFIVHAWNQADWNDCLSPIDRLPLERYSSPGSFAILTRLFSDLALIWSDNSHYRLLRCRSILLHIISELFRNLGESHSSSSKNEILHKVAEYMKKHYECKHSLSELADMAQLTPSYFGQQFKALTGETPMAYLNSMRIDKALEYMAIGYSISEASSKCGFKDPFYFSRVFKYKKGMSPTDYLNRGELML